MPILAGPSNSSEPKRGEVEWTGVQWRLAGRRVGIPGIPDGSKDQCDDIEARGWPSRWNILLAQLLRALKSGRGAASNRATEHTICETSEDEGLRLYSTQGYISFLLVFSRKSVSGD